MYKRMYSIFTEDMIERFQQRVLEETVRREYIHINPILSNLRVRNMNMFIDYLQRTTTAKETTQLYQEAINRIGQHIDTHCPNAPKVPLLNTTVIDQNGRFRHDMLVVMYAGEIIATCFVYCDNDPKRSVYKVSYVCPNVNDPDNQPNPSNELGLFILGQCLTYWKRETEIHSLVVFRDDILRNHVSSREEELQKHPTYAYELYLREPILERITAIYPNTSSATLYPMLNLLMDTLNQRIQSVLAHITPPPK